MISREPFTGWIVKEELGAGSFGKVFRVEKDSYSSAVKQIIIPNNSQYSNREQDANIKRDVKQLLNYYKPQAEKMRIEIEIMQKLSGIQGIVTYYDHLIREYSVGFGWEILIRMEYLMPLNKYIRKNGLKIKQVLELGKQICSALEICKKENILHRDIKKNNILVDEHGNFKLGDFGVSRLLSNIEQASTVVGTYGYIAPEIIKGEKYDYSADMYSLGVVLYSLLNEEMLPFENKNMNISEVENAREMLLCGNNILSPKYGNKEISEVIIKSFANSKENRYESFKVMKIEIEKLLNNVEKEVLEKIVLNKENVLDKEKDEIVNSLNYLNIDINDNYKNTITIDNNEYFTTITNEKDQIFKNSKQNKIVTKKNVITKKSSKLILVGIILIVSIIGTLYYLKSTTGNKVLINNTNKTSKESNIDEEYKDNKNNDSVIKEVTPKIGDGIRGDLSDIIDENDVNKEIFSSLNKNEKIALKIQYEAIDQSDVSEIYEIELYLNEIEDMYHVKGIKLLKNKDYRRLFWINGEIQRTEIIESYNIN